MPVDLFEALKAIESEDGQLKTAAKKIAHEPEMGHMDAANVTSGLGQAVGRGPMDAKALLDEKALEAAGTELESRTFQDPRERSGARNLNTRPAPGPVSPTDSSRPATKPSNVHLKTGPATHRPDTLAGGKTAASVKELAGKAWGAIKGKGQAMAKSYEDARSTHALGRAGKGKLRSHFEGAKAVAKQHPKTVGGAAAGLAAAGGGAAYARSRRKKHAGLSLATFIEASQLGEAGIKMASQTYGEDEILARTIQVREAQSVGMKLACGMFKAAAAEAQGQ